ncbi:MAG: alpha/beta hydrolase family protein [Planctomycetales bacterium]
MHLGPFDGCSVVNPATWPSPLRRPQGCSVVCRWGWLAAFAALLIGARAGTAADDPVFDVRALLDTPLNAKVLKSTVSGQIVTEEVRFHSERDGEQDVEIFAFFSYPKGGRRLPAYIWNPGGLSQSSPAFTEVGARRGYATLCIDFPQKGYRSTGNYDIIAGLVLEGDPRRAPIYHGAVALLKAVSFLESRPEVDRQRIGMAGSSWGGFFTTFMAGIDPRPKVASSLYGSGNLHLGNAWWDGDSKNGREPPSPDERERWRTTLDPAWRLPTKRIPIAWITGVNDQFYLLPGVIQSHEMAAGPRHLTLLPNWHHALPQKLHDELVLAWLDVHLKGAPPFPTATPLVIQNDRGRLTARWEFQGKATVADLIVSYGDAGNWRGRYWHTLPAQIKGSGVVAEFPASRLPCFVSGSITDPRGIRVSTPVLKVEAQQLGNETQRAVPDYNGCAEWGGFEEDHLAYLARHNASGQTRWIPQPSRDPYRGKQSALLKPGRTDLAPILSTATIPHRLTAYLKADRPTRVSLSLAGETAEFDVGNKWTQIQMEHTPPNTLMGGTFASITSPEGSVVLIDQVEFRPIPSDE